MTYQLGTGKPLTFFYSVPMCPDPDPHRGQGRWWPPSLTQNDLTPEPIPSQKISLSRRVRTHRSGTCRPRDASSNRTRRPRGRIVQRDASSKGTHRPKGRIVQRDASSKGTHRPKGSIIQGTHCLRDGIDETFRSRTHRFPTTGYVLPTTGYVLPMTGYALPTTGYVLPTTGYVLTTTGYVLPTTGYVLHTTGYDLPSTGYALPMTGYSFPSLISNMYDKYITSILTQNSTVRCMLRNV